MPDCTFIWDFILQLYHIPSPSQHKCLLYCQLGIMVFWILACKIVNAVPIICISCTIYTLVVISFERYLSIVRSPPKPLSAETVKKLIILIWMTAISISLPVAWEFTVYDVLSYKGVDHMNNNSTTPYPEDKEETSDDRSYSTHQLHMTSYNLFTVNEQETIPTATQIYPSSMVLTSSRYLECGSDKSPRQLSIFNGIFILLVTYIIPTTIIWTNYALVIRFILAYTKRELNRQSLQNLSQVFKRRLRIVKMLIIVAALFGFCWLPYFCVFTYTNVTGKADSTYFDGPFNMLRIFLSVFSVTYNVCVYAIYNQAFRKGFLDLLKCKWCYSNNAAVSPSVLSYITTARRS